MTHTRFRFALGLLVFAVGLVQAGPLVAAAAPKRARQVKEPPRRPFEEARIQKVVDDVRKQLAIRQAVTVSIIERNPLMASVEPDRTLKGAFLLSLERGVAQKLSADELVAVVAHELGHVWIFTHHPYLQTESLANQVAMRVVTRERLEQVYEKVWKHGGEKGDIARFMGPPARPTAAALAPIQGTSSPR
jgi:hypothetical protein